MTKPPLRYAELEAEIDAWAGASGASADSPKAQRIVREAAPLFARYGYRRASMDDIAREAGVAKGTLYLYFKSKAELLFAVLMEEKKRSIRRFRDVFGEDLKPDERLRRYVERVFATMHESPLSLMLLRGDREIQTFTDELPPELREQLEIRRSDYLEALLSGVGHFDALGAEERRARREAFHALLQAGLSYVAAQAPELSREELARQVAKILTDGVAAP